jgi:hypothetical protein
MCFRKKMPKNRSYFLKKNHKKSETDETNYIKLKSQITQYIIFSAVKEGFGKIKSST